MKLEEYLEHIQEYLREYLANAKSNGYVLGLSGGVDSSLAAALTRNAVGKDKLMCLIMPIDSNPADLRDAVKVAEALGLRKTNQVAEHYETPVIKGMINKISHLLEVTEA